MAKWLDLILKVAPWVGLASAVLAGFANTILEKQHWVVPLLITSFAGMWTSFLGLARELKAHVDKHVQYIDEAQRHRLFTEKLLQESAKPVDDKKLALISVLRSPFLKESGIDDIFWARYCKFVLHDAYERELDAGKLYDLAKDIDVALKDRKVVAPTQWAYQLMKDLFEDVVRPGGDPYKGVFTEADLASSIDIDELVFELPLRSDRNVWRIFALSSDKLRTLSKRQRDRLIKQLERRHIELRVLDHPSQSSISNIGIYGGEAYGELKGQTNTFDFDKERVRRRSRDFAELWAKTRPLRASDLDDAPPDNAADRQQAASPPVAAR